MRNSCLFLLLVCLLFGCNKPLPDYSGQPFDYTVVGIMDISVPANDYIFLTPQVNVISGLAEHQPVTVTLSGLPAGVFVKENGFSILLNNQLNDSIGARNATQGVYPIKAVFSNASGAPKTYNFNLTIAPPTNRVASVSGYYYPSNSCSNNIYVSCEIDSVPGVPNEIMIIDRVSDNPQHYGTFDTAYATVDCCTNTFVIPLQNVQGTIVQGSGSFSNEGGSNKKVLMNRTFTNGTNSSSCIVTLGQP